MPDTLYDRDILSWSEQQADLLRRAAHGERVNGVDWAHVAEEIEDLGLSQLNAVQSSLVQLLVHLLKVHGWPHNQARVHWRIEIVSFQQNAARRFAPSMRQRIDVARLHRDAVHQLEGRCSTVSSPRNGLRPARSRWTSCLTIRVRHWRAASSRRCRRDRSDRPGWPSAGGRGLRDGRGFATRPGREGYFEATKQA
jgi:hypothetical protein